MASFPQQTMVFNSTLITRLSNLKIFALWRSGN